MLATSIQLGLAGAGEVTAVLELLERLGATELDLGEDETTVIALFTAEPEVIEAQLRHALRLLELPVTQLTTERVETVDWGASRRAALVPLRIGPLWIVPEGAEASAKNSALILESGPAFGSGAHPTTRLCLERIVELSPIEHLADAGTGNGILSLAALALGGQRATATELDPEARQIAQRNAEKNGLAGRFVLAGALPEQATVAVANIAGGALQGLAPALVKCLAPGGALSLSGLRESEEEELRARYVDLGLRAIGRAELRGWVRLDFVTSW